MEEMTYGYTFWLENLKGKYHAEYIGVDRRIILQWI
jgi:hypothetical protein